MNTSHIQFHIDEHLTLLVNIKKIELSEEIVMQRMMDRWKGGVGKEVEKERREERKRCNTDNAGTLCCTFGCS